MQNKIVKCRSCSSPSLIPFFNLGKQPLANSLTTSKNEVLPLYDLALSFCKSCTLVQLSVDVDAPEMFSNYLWMTGTSEVAKSHSKTLSSELLSLVGPMNAKDFVFEVASNDGTFLSYFKSSGCNVVGIDPAENLVTHALESNINTICGFFSSKKASKLESSIGRARIVVCRNVLAHVPDIQDFVEGLSKMLTDDGVMLIEVHYAGSILNGLQYDSIYHEHASYISLSAIEPQLKKLNLEVFDVKLGPISGGCLTLFIKNAKNKKFATKDTVELFRKNEAYSGIGLLDTWKAFGDKAFQHKIDLNNIIDELSENHITICGFGASARSSTLLNFCNITNNKLSCIADNNPLKQGLFTAGTGIQIVTPNIMYSEKPAAILLLAWNFKDEILSIIRESGFNGKVILPLPTKPEIITI